MIDLVGKLPTRYGARPYYVRARHGIVGGRIHYTASSTWSTVEAIAEFQTGPTAQESFPAIAYHYLVDGYGRAYRCHDLATRVWGSAQPGSNETDVHVCYTGIVGPNAAQMRGLSLCIRDAEVELQRTLVWRGHKDGYPTLCPGPLWPAWEDQLLDGADGPRAGA